MLITNYDYRATGTKIVQDIPALHCKALLFKFTGTNASGQAVTRANLGELQIILGSKEIDRVDLDKLWGMVDKLYASDYGKSEFTSTTASTIDIEVIRPFHLPGDVVAILQTNPNELKLKFTHSSLTSVVDSLDLAIHAIPRLGVNKYLLKFQNFSYASQSNNAAPSAFPFSNISLLHLDYSASLVQTRFQKDGKDIIKADTLADLHHYRTLYNGVRSGDAFADADSNFNGFDFNIASGGLETALGNRYSLLLSAASSVNFTGALGLISMNENAMVRSLANYNERVEINMNAGK